MYKLLSAVFLCLFVAASAVGAGTEPELVRIPIRKAYIPVGFDSNDRTEVVITGILPDSCYKMGPNHVTVDAATGSIAIEQNAYLFEGYCTDMIIPFTQVVSVGMLPRGSFTVADLTTGKKLGALPVTEGSHPTVDDYHYLPVSNAYVQEDSATQIPKAVLVGTYADRCTVFKKAKVHYYPEVIVIQPIVERLEVRDCGEAKVRFSVSVPLKKGLKGTQLIHVRSMGGQSFNTLFEFP